MRLDGTDVPLSNVRESGGIISFSATVPGSPGTVLNYSGAIQGNQLGVASQDLGSGSLYADGAARRVLLRKPRWLRPRRLLRKRHLGAKPRRSLHRPRRRCTNASIACACRLQLRRTGGPARSSGPAARLGRAGSGRLCRAPAGQLHQASDLRRHRRLHRAAAASRRKRAAAASAGRSTCTFSGATGRPRLARGGAAPASARRASKERGARANQHLMRSDASAATLNFIRDGDRVAGVLRTAGQEFPLFDVKQTGAELSFSIVIPGTPYETVLYRGTVAERPAGAGRARRDAGSLRPDRDPAGRPRAGCR